MTKEQLKNLLEGLGVKGIIDGRENLRALCPFHSETHASWGIATSKALSPWCCYTCGERGGSLLSLVWKLLPDPTPQKVHDFIAKYGKFSGIIVDDYASYTQRQQIRKLMEHENLPDYYLDAYKLCREFRGHEKAIIFNFQLRKEMCSEGVIVPYRKQQNLLGLVHHGISRELKTLPLFGFRPKQFLYQPPWLDVNKDIIVVEGFADAIRVYSYGHHNVVALSGASMTQAQAREIRMTGARRIHLMLDTDDAGNVGVGQAYKLLKDLSVFDSREYGAKDPDLATKDGVETALKSERLIA